jgi:transposase
MDAPPRTPYPTDVSDVEWAFLAPHPTLMREVQRQSPLRGLFNGLPPWHAVYQQTRRWLDADVFGAIITDLRELVRLGADQAPQPSATVLDSRTLQSTPDARQRAGWSGAKRRKWTKVHRAVDPLGPLLALHITPANAQDQAQVATLAAAVQETTGQTVTIAYVDQGDTGDEPRQAAADAGITREVVTPPEAKRGFVLLPRRWVIERDVCWLSRFRRLARGQDRLAEVLRSVHLLAFVMLMWKHAFPLLSVL